MIHNVSIAFKASFKEVSRGYQGSFDILFKDFTRSSRIVLRVFHGNFKGDSRDFQG